MNLLHQSASLLSGPPTWSKVLDQPVSSLLRVQVAVSDQPVTARGNWLQEILIPVIGLGEMTRLNLPHQLASLLLGPPTWSKVLDQPVSSLLRVQVAVSDQPVTARGNWLHRNSYTSHWSW